MKSREQFIKDLAPKKFTKPEKIWVGLIIGPYFSRICWPMLIKSRSGLQVTSLNDYALWGIYISNFRLSLLPPVLLVPRPWPF